MSVSMPTSIHMASNDKISE